LKILILKPSSLGDVIQALPVLRLLKQHRPASAIYWWLDSRLLPLLEGDPDLAGVVPFERQRWGSPRHWPEMWRSVRWLRAQRFDWVLDLQCLARSGAFAWLTNGGLLAGLDEPREGARGYYDLVVPRRSWHTHAVDWYLSLLPRLGVPVHWDFDWLPERPALAAAVRRKWPLNGARWVALLPGARWANKRWPVEHFARLTRWLADQDPALRLVILGGAEDRPLGGVIAEAAPACLDLTGRTTLPEMIEWLRACQFVISNDTGPMHVAAALRKPIIGLFGPTEPARTGPYGQVEQVLQNRGLPCVPCMSDRCRYVQPLECLRSLTPEDVARHVLAHLPAPGAGRVSGRRVE
jgi:heptosyltransferase I